MHKRGQIALFLLLALSLIILGGFLWFGTSSSAGVQSQSSAQKVSLQDVENVELYIETCLDSAAQNTLYNRIGKQGGYIDPKEETLYALRGLPPNHPAPVQFQEWHLPYYTYNSRSYFPSLDDINSQIQSAVLSDVEACFAQNEFLSLGLSVQKPQGSQPSLAVGINANDVSFSLLFPLEIKRGSAQSSLSQFSLSVPIRLLPAHENARHVVEILLDPNRDQSSPLDIAPFCSQYDSNQMTNTYIKQSDDESARIVQFIDFSSRESGAGSFIFQFATDMVIEGRCAS